jgi:carboxyl-terminal processing protease
MKFLNSRKFLVLALIVVFSSFALGAWAKKGQSQESVIHDLETFAKIVEKVKSYYVEEVDTHEMIEEAIQGMLRELDPHSQYLTGLDYEDLMVSTQGQFGGLGIYISFRDNYPTVISPIDGTPAARARIQSGDQIVEIEGESSDGWSVQKAVRYLRGEPGSSVRFKISRPGLSDPIEYSLVRERIQVESVTYSGMFEDNVGYVKLSSFSKSTREELHAALRDLEAQGMEGLVLDLRSNPGGLLQAATGVSELFLDKDKLVVYTKGRYAQNNQKYYASKSRKHTGYPIIVMVNGASASASEIVAGALQDWDAAFVVGQISFGKGTVQTVFSLSDSQAVKLTTAKYYTPSGRSIHKDHVRVEQVATGEEDFNANDKELELVEDSDDPESKTDRPLYHTSSGRIVYGGGGITPDIEFEPKKYGEIERHLERDALLFTFAVEYSTENEVTEDFEVDDKILAEFKELLAEREFEYTEEEFSGDSLDYIKKAILREVVSKNFGRKAMYRVLLERDSEFQRVIEIYTNTPTLTEMFAWAEQQNDVKKASNE